MTRRVKLLDSERAHSYASRVRERDQTAVGLIGGSADRRLATSRIPPLEFAGVLAPRRRGGDDERFATFVAHRPLHIEIGFGRPHHLAELAAMYPDAHVLGFEVRRRWCRDAARRAAREGLSNVRVVEGDVRTLFDALPLGGVAAFHVLFPDPWWKKRHHKRRIFQPPTVTALHDLLVPGGWLVTKTDVPAYADLIEEVVLDHGGFVRTPTAPLAELPLSHREKKCRDLGIPVTWLRFVKETDR